LVEFSWQLTQHTSGKCLPNIYHTRPLTRQSNPMGGYGCMTAVIDVGGLADCFIGLYEGRVGEEILDTYAEVRREKFLKYVDARSIKNLNRVATSDPWTVLETDKFFGILRDLEGDEEETRKFLLVRMN
jgi:hypothetical protein